MTFLPIVFRLALRLSQIPADEALASPGRLTSCIRDAVRLLSPSLVVNHFDLAVLAQVAGCIVERSMAGYRIVSRPPGALEALQALTKKGALRDAPGVSAILESTSRLAAEFQGRPGVVAAAPGPLSLLAQLFEPDGDRSAEAMELAGEVLVHLVTEYCDRGATMILIAEELVQPPSADLVALSAECLDPVWNVARYYGRPSIYLRRGALDQTGAEAAFKIGSDHVALPPQLSTMAGDGDARRCPTLPLSLLRASREEMRSSLIRLLRAPGSSGPVLTEWEVPAESDVQALRGLMAAVGE